MARHLETQADRDRSAMRAADVRLGPCIDGTYPVYGPDLTGTGRVVRLYAIAGAERAHAAAVGHAYAVLRVDA